ncbi:hypothetical protein AB0C33_38975 [Nonomuraea sp. NPDC048881]|uniref:hypothetical protein n=1 Tax=Nonomuraea sp. NPDC048881 TaxID=3155030 RepID=UPI003405C4FA
MSRTRPPGCARPAIRALTCAVSPYLAEGRPRIPGAAGVARQPGAADRVARWRAEHGTDPEHAGLSFYRDSGG